MRQQSQHELDRAVALATGESAREIRRRGFVPLEDVQQEDGQRLDWDTLAARRLDVFPRRRAAIAS